MQDIYDSNRILPIVSRKLEHIFTPEQANRLLLEIRPLVSRVVELKYKIDSSNEGRAIKVPVSWRCKFQNLKEGELS